MLTWDHGSPGATRPAYAAFLTQAGRGAAAGLAGTAGQIWAGVADRAAAYAAGGVAAHDPAAAITDLADRVAAVVEVEEGLAEALG